MTAAPVLAQDKPACAATDAAAALPEGFSDWTSPSRTVAKVAIGAAYDLPLVDGVRLTAPVPAGKGGPRAALVTVNVPAAGRYRVGASTPVWIELVGQSGPIASAAHGHGPVCTTIRKIVDFDLAAGRHTLQFSAGDAASVRFIVVRKP